MKNFKEIFRLAWSYPWLTVAVIGANIMFVIFNLLSMVLFIPFLQLIFRDGAETVVPPYPVREEGIVGFFEHIQNLYDYFMKSMVAEDPSNALLFVCCTVVAAFFFKNLSRYTASWKIGDLRFFVVRDMRNKIYTKSMRLPLSFYSEERKGDLMSRMNNDANEIEYGIPAMLEILFRDPISIILTISVLVYWSPELTAISFVLMPITSFVIAKIGKSLKRTAKQEKEKMGLLNSFLDETLAGIRIVKAFNAVSQVENQFKEMNLSHQRLTTKAFRKQTLSSPLNEFLGSAVMLTIAWFGGRMILDPEYATELTGEKFLGFIIVFSQLLRPIQSISNSIATLNKSSASLDRIHEILNTDEKIMEAKNPKSVDELKEGIRFENISFKYKEDWVIKNLSLNIPKGKKIALVGESGSGKSTLADLLPRFYDVQEGQIYFDNEPLRELSLHDLRNQIGIVSQESILFNDTIAANIAFGQEEINMEAVIEAAKIANAHDFISEMPDGYETIIGERGGKLSGGQRQRLSIARAVLKNPSLLILDEATSALDTESEKLVQDAIEKLMQNRTSLVIAHRLSTVLNADEILVLQKGQIAERGTHAELMQKEGLYFKLCSLQGIFN